LPPTLTQPSRSRRAMIFLALVSMAGIPIICKDRKI
jgi:hypothetical protein